MKLRLTDTTIRLRLNKPDLQKLQNERILSVKLPLGLSPNQQFTYSLITGNSHTSTIIHIMNNHLMIEVPSNSIDHWISSEEVGIYQEINTEDRSTIQLIIEKDFQCTSDPIDSEMFFTNPKLEQN
jgi:hypothetical protein